MDLLVKLATDFENDNFRGQCYVIELIETISKHLDGLHMTFNKDHDQIAHISSLQQNCLKVLCSIFNCQTFSETIFSDSCYKKVRTCLAIMKSR